jgi:hypothetical protein
VLDSEDHRWRGARISERLLVIFLKLRVLTEMTRDLVRNAAHVDGATVSRERQEVEQTTER